MFFSDRGGEGEKSETIKKFETTERFLKRTITMIQYKDIPDLY